MSGLAQTAARPVERGLSPAGCATLRVVEGLDCPFGLERSVKIAPGGVNGDRFLATLHRDELGEDAARGLSMLAAKLGMPGPALPALLRSLPEADIVHVGHEGGEQPTTKLYLEFAAGVQAARESGAGRPQLVHLAAKWRSGGGEATLSRYVWPADGRGAAAIGRRLGALAATSPAARLALCLLDLARPRCSDDDLMYMDVEEEGTRRRSFDLNLYAAGLAVADAADALEALAGDYGLGPGLPARLPVAGPGDELGHVSGGGDRSGRDFATLYFGVEAREGGGRG